MKKFLRKYSLPYGLKKLVKKTRKKCQNPKYADAKSVLMFFTSEGNQKIALVKGLQNKMEKEGKVVSCLYLVLSDEDKPDVHMDEGMERLVQDDFSLFGVVEKPEVKNLMKEEYDFLIHADMESSVYTDLIMSQCNAKCRVGRHFEGHERLYDMMVGIPKDKKVNFLLDQLYFYTKAL